VAIWKGGGGNFGEIPNNKQKIKYTNKRGIKSFLYKAKVKQKTLYTMSARKHDFQDNKRGKLDGLVV
jgi:hypothetical protein